jgi:hypothetical protein
VIADGIKHAWNPATSNKRRHRDVDNKKGEPEFAFLVVVGADGVEPPTYAL